MPSVRANGIEIGYDVEGDGPPLVMLHSASSIGRADFAAQLPAFRRTFRVYLPDARGHGRTRWDVSRGFGQDLLTDDLEAFVDALDLERIHLLGFSMGGMTALQFASRQPDRVRTLVVSSIEVSREPRASVARRAMDPDRIERENPTWAARLGQFHDQTQGPGAWHDLLRAIAADVGTQRLLGPADLRRISCPTLVVAGDRDPFVPVDHAWALMRQLPDGRLLIVPACGHEVPVLRPAIFNEACSGFYRMVESSARPATAHGPSTAGLAGDSDAAGDSDGDTAAAPSETAITPT